MASHSFKLCDFDECSEPAIGNAQVFVDGTVINLRVDGCVQHLAAMVTRFADFGIKRDLFYRAFEAIAKRLLEKEREEKSNAR